MSTLRRLAIALSLSTALVGAGAGSAVAGPAIAAVAAFAATPVGGIVVSAGVSLAAAGVSSLISNLINPPEERPGTRAVAGYSGTVPSDPTAPIGFTMGTRAVAGTIVYRGVWGSANKVPNAYYVEERVFSDVPLADDPGPSKIVIGKKRYNIDWDAVPTSQGYPIPALNRDGKDYGWFRWHGGDQVAADTYLRNKFGSHPDQPYTSDMVGRGQAKGILTVRVNPKVFKTGFPEWKIETVGIAMYNIAKDTTAGGSGSHRIDDPATWEPSDLLPVHIFNALLGVRYGDEWVWGGQSTAASQLPASSWIAAIAEANTTVDTKDGTEKQYIGGMEITGDMEPASVIEHQLRGCDGRFAEIGGVFKMLCGLPASPVFSFTDANIVVSRQQGYDPFPQPESTFNAILSKYWERSGGWQLKDVPELRNEDWIAEDGGYRAANVTYEAVQSGTQAQRLNTSALSDGRRWRTHQLGLPPEASELEPLDMVAWSSERRGYTSKKFLIDAIDDEETFEQFATMREVDPADHGSYDPDADEQDMVFPTLDLTAPDPVVMAGYSAAAAVMAGDNGAQRPTIDLTIPGGLDDVAFIRVTIRRDADDAQVWSAVLPYTQGLADGSTYVVRLGAVLLQLTAYQVQCEELPFSSSRDVAASAWLDVTTGAVPLGPADIYGLTLATLAEEVRSHVADLSSSVRSLIENAQELATLGAGEALYNYDEHKQIRRELQLTKDDVVARYTEAITIATGPGSAIASRFETLEATVNVTQASAINLLTARVDGHDAYAAAITQVSAGTIGGDINSATLRMVAQNGIGGSAEVAFQVKNSTYRTASLILRAPSSPSSPTEVVIDAQSFKVGDFTSGSELNPLVYSGGAWRLAVANIGTVNAGLIQSLSGLSYWNLSTGAFRIATS